ncbi:MAG: cell division protein SepF [Candidatus Izemoplasmatales bacterium]|nr:cell division protein SepF [Candidatus Izemoplasmatales bacterium]
MGLFGKKQVSVSTDVDLEDVKFYRVQDASGIYDYAEVVMHRVPIVMNFDSCLLSEANEVLLFLTGVLYACDGEVVKIQDKIYLMAQKSDLAGPTLKKFIAEYQKK